MTETINHPAHYGGADNPYETIKVLEAWGLGFHLGNAVKYISRAGKKDPGKTLEDLKKARWYLDRLIEISDPKTPEPAEKRNRDWYGDVLNFHKKFGCCIGMIPNVPTQGTVALRQNIIEEEYEELNTALDRGDLPGIADAVCDLIYVLLGTAISYGIDIRPIWNAVHESNMAKTGGGTRTDGKILKPAGWQPPPVAELLRKQVKIR